MLVNEYGRKSWLRQSCILPLSQFGKVYLQSISSIFVWQSSDTMGLDKGSIEDGLGMFDDRAHHCTFVYGVSRLKVIFGFLHADDWGLPSMTTIWLYFLAHSPACN